MRIFKRVATTSSAALEEEVKLWEKEGWKSGRSVINIQALHPYQRHMYKDLVNHTKKRQNLHLSLSE